MSLLYLNNRTNRKYHYKRAIHLCLFIASFYFVAQKVLAQTCTPLYGGGEECVYNKRFSLVKDVKIKDEDDDRFRDKVGTLEPGDDIVFQIVVKNTGDKEVDKVEIIDNLPEEIELTAGKTEWEIENFKPDEEVIFSFDARIVDEDELGSNKEICVVNKAELYYEGELENADTATVCINTPVVTPISKDLEELPKDGADLIINTYLIVSLIATGIILRRS